MEFQVFVTNEQRSKSPDLAISAAEELQLQQIQQLKFWLERQTELPPVILAAITIEAGATVAALPEQCMRSRLIH